MEVVMPKSYRLTFHRAPKKKCVLSLLETIIITFADGNHKV